MAECRLRLKYGKFTIGEWYNKSGTDCCHDDDMKVINSPRICRAGEPIKLELLDSQSGTTGLHLVLDVKDFRRSRRRRRYRRRY